jgi:hypothetical protein
MKKTLPIIALLCSVHAWAQTDQHGPAVTAPHILTHQEADANSTYELVSFMAEKRQGHGISLRWTTATEAPNSRFTIERSSDRMNWVPVLSTDGEGARSGYHNYEVTDLAPLSGVSYYRLKANAQGMSLETSDEQVVDYRPGPALHFQNDREQGHFTVSASGKLTDVQVLNDRGQFIPMELDYGDDGVLVNAVGLEPGTYFVQALLNGSPVLRPVILTGTGVIGG